MWLDEPRYSGFILQTFPEKRCINYHARSVKLNIIFQTIKGNWSYHSENIFPNISIYGNRDCELLPIDLKIKCKKLNLFSYIVIISAKVSFQNKVKSTLIIIGKQLVSNTWTDKVPNGLLNFRKEGQSDNYMLPKKAIPFTIIFLI